MQHRMGRSLDDIRHGGGRPVSLRRSEPAVSPPPFPPARHPRRRGLSGSWLARLDGPALAVLLIAASVLLLLRQSNAESVRLYPQSCLGGWQNPGRAAGIPESEAAGTDVGPENAAALHDAYAEIFCGGFAGSVPDGTAPRHVTLTPYWLVTEGAAPSTQDDLPLPDDLPSPEEGLSEAPAPEPVSLIVATAHAQETTEQEPAPSDASSPEEESAPAPDAPVAEPPAPEEPAAPASAEQEPAPETYAPAPTSVPTPEGVNAEPAAMEPPVAEVRYTLDGVTWSSLGTVTRSSWKDASFDIELPGITWQALGALQVSVTPVLSTDVAPSLYVDGFALEVAYEPSVAEEPPVPAFDPGSFRFSGISVQGAAPAPALVTDAQSGDRLTLKGFPAGTLKIYSDDDPGFSFVTGLGQGELDLQAYFFAPGRYTAIATREPSGCAAFTLATCLSDAGTLGTLRFTVAYAGAGMPTSAPEAPAPPPATASSAASGEPEASGGASPFAPLESAPEGNE